LFRPRERAFKQFKCPRPQCVKTVSVATKWLVLSMQMVKAGARHGGWLRIYRTCNRVEPKKGGPAA